MIRVDAIPELPLADAAQAGAGELDGQIERVAEACKQAQAAGQRRTTGLAPLRLVPQPESSRRQRVIEEAMRLLALVLCNRATEQPLHALLVMGAYDGDGRTTTVGHLGLALASMGHRVIVVNADYRKPDLAHLVQPKEEDFRDAIDDGSIQVAPGAEPGLTVVELKSADSPIFCSQAALATLLSELRLLADFILIDSPPCLGCSEPFFLAPLVDGLLYVIRQRKQDVEAQRAVQGQLSRLGVKVLGVVYNERRNRWQERFQR